MAKEYPRGLIQKLAEGYSGPGAATQALGEFRRLGGAMRTQTWYRLWSEIKNEQSLAGVEEGRDLRFRPTAGEIQTLTTRRATGFHQRVTVFGRTQTGYINSMTFNVKTSTPRARWWAIRKAEEWAQGMQPGQNAHPDTVIVQTLGAVYQGTFQLQPE